MRNMNIFMIIYSKGNIQMKRSVSHIHTEATIELIILLLVLVIMISGGFAFNSWFSSPALSTVYLLVSCTSILVIKLLLDYANKLK